MAKKKGSSLKKEINTLYRISRFIDSITDLKELLRLIMEESKKVVDAEASSLLLYDREKDELYFEVALGDKGEKVKKIRLKRGEGVAGAVVKKKKAINVRDVQKTDVWYWSADRISGFKTRSLLAVPMIRKGNLVGVIEVLNKRGKHFTNEDIRIMEILAEQAALCIENARLYEENLRAARMAAIGQTMAELSHYIKNVLTGFEAGGYLLESGTSKQDYELIKKGWSFLKKSQEKISNLVMNMLNYSKEKEPSFQLHDVNKVVRDVASLMEPRLKEKHIEFEKKLAKNMQKIMLDSDGIYRCILNLISNAMDAVESQKNGKITINTLYDKKNRQVKIEVKDNGKGIPKDKVQDVFNLFYSSKSKGTGLGLTVTKKIIDEHKGKILVESQEKKGTKFTIILPASKKK
jgi:signal transduction histidine kinase